MEPKTEFPTLSQVVHIPWSDLTLGSLVGKGGYGVVHRGQWGTLEVAIKQLHLETLSPELVQAFTTEATLMAKCRFPQIIDLFGVCTQSPHYALVMAYAPKGSLYQVLQDTHEALPWNPLRWNIAIEIGQGLAYLHAQQILHRDIKSLNVLLDGQYHAKLTDFGMAKIKVHTQSTTTQHQKGMGTTRWLAPELFKRGGKHTFASDMYGYGMVLWEIASRHLPYADAANDMVAMGWIKDGEKETIPDDCPEKYAKLIQQSWASPEARPSAHELHTALTQAKPIEPLPVGISYTPRAWHFDPKTKQQADLKGKEYVLLPATEEDKTKVADFYLPHPVSGYSLGKVEVIYNPGFNRAFALHLRKLQQRHQNPAFAPTWSTMDNAPWRKTIVHTLETFTQAYTDTNYPNVTLVPAWHGTKESVLPSLFTAGYANLATTDAGFFGKGYYSALEAEYSYRVYSKGALILNWVACFSPLPVVYADMELLEGRSNYKNYDAHFVPVVPQNPINPDENVYVPCHPHQKAKYYELVVFDSAAILPRYVVTLQPDIVKTPSPPVIPGEAGYVKGLNAFHHAHYRNAKDAFEDAAAQAYPAAYLWLGRLYHYDGYIGSKNETLKEQWYQKVRANINWFHTQAQTSRADAQVNLGWCYQLGIGLKKNEKEAVRYYRLAAEQGNADAQRKLGWCYLTGTGVEKNEKEAAHYVRLAAEQGYAKAQSNLGWCYLTGTGVEKNEKEAVRYYRLAAEQGEAEAQYGLGVRYEKGIAIEKNEVEAVRYYCLAAEQGDAKAQCSLGKCYEAGRGVEKNETEAVRYYQLAAEQGLDVAQCQLGWCYYKGTGIEKNEKEAVRYYRLAAAQGHAEAQCNLGLCYEFGRGLEKNEKEAVRYYRLATEQGHARAQCCLGLCYDNGTGVEKNEKEAVRYVCLAAEQGEAEAQFNLGWCYAKGIGLEKNEKEAVRYYRLAAEQGHANAQFKLGVCYHFGLGIEKDEVEAVRYYRLAAEQGHANAQFKLGVCYHFGLGIGKDEVEAVRYYRLAAEQGHAKAQIEFEKLLQQNPHLKSVSHTYTPHFFPAAPQDIPLEELGEEAYFKGLKAVHYAHYLQAKACFEDAVAQAYPAAYLWLGRLYQEDGLIGPKNETLKEQWYQKVRTSIDWFQAQVKKGRTDAQVNLGVCYEDGIGVEKDEKEAVRCYRLAADQGYARAQVNLGMCYEDGIGVEKDEKEAVRYYRLAAEQGHAEAQCTLGVCYHLGEGVEKDEKEAVRYYRLAAEQGDAEAQYNLGLCYEFGAGVEKDKKEALRYYRLAVEQGHTKAQIELETLLKQNPHLKSASHIYAPHFFPAVPQEVPLEEPGEAAYFKGLQEFHHARYLQAKACFEDAAAKNYPAAYLWLGRLYNYDGYIGSKNETLKEQWYQKVRASIDWFHAQAQTGRADAQYNLGWCYQLGIGLEKNEKEAARYYHMAAEQGEVDAQCTLGVCYKEGIGIEKNDAEAVRYYRLAADQGHANAQFNLGGCYDNGTGVEKDEKEAVRYYRLAAEQGNARGQCQLGLRYYAGRGIEKDAKEAVRYFRLAAKQEYANAQFKLGICYHFGLGIEKDEVEAVHYYRLATEQGHAKAQIELETLLQQHPHLKSASPAYTPHFFQAAPPEILLKVPTVKNKEQAFIPKKENENCCVM